jgi:hypothetical protein
VVRERLEFLDGGPLAGVGGGCPLGPTDVAQPVVEIGELLVGDGEGDGFTPALNPPGFGGFLLSALPSFDSGLFMGGVLWSGYLGRQSVYVAMMDPTDRMGENKAVTSLIDCRTEACECHARGYA